MYTDVFSRESARQSVKDLANKTKQLKQERRALLTHARTQRQLSGERRQPVSAWWAKYHSRGPGAVFNEQQHVVDPNYEAFRACEERMQTRGSCARYHGLAYAFLRGRAYRRCEQHTRNAVSARVLAEVLWHHVLSGLDVTLLRKTLLPGLLADLSAWLETS